MFQYTNDVLLFSYQLDQIKAQTLFSSHPWVTRGSQSLMFLPWYWDLGTYHDEGVRHDWIHYYFRICLMLSVERSWA